MRKQPFIILGGSLLVSLVLAAIIIHPQSPQQTDIEGQLIEQKVLGQTVDSVNTGYQSHFSQITLPTSTKALSSPSLLPIPTIASHAIDLVNVPQKLTEGDTATFTWDMSGPATTIHTTTVYYGRASSANVSSDTDPKNTAYTDWLKDFMQGDYNIPLRFVGSIRLGAAGTYYFRTYAKVGGKHFWSPEHILTVHPIPKHEIKIIQYSHIVSPGHNAAFTWDIVGPSATTGFTVIVGSKESKPENLDASVDLPKTPYAILVKDFMSGMYAVPLRFIGNTTMTDRGVYYFRALAFINDKNIWSDEFSFTVD